jgi:hypothetical protein
MKWSLSYLPARGSDPGWAGGDRKRCWGRAARRCRDPRHARMVDRAFFRFWLLGERLAGAAELHGEVSELG